MNWYRRWKAIGLLGKRITITTCPALPIFLPEGWSMVAPNAFVADTHGKAVLSVLDWLATSLNNIVYVKLNGERGEVHLLLSRSGGVEVVKVKSLPRG